MKVIVEISANQEWQAVLPLFPGAALQASPVGEWFEQFIACRGQMQLVIFFHGGWGKIAAAAATQYVIDRWLPDVLVNLGTCGGFEGEIAHGTILLVERTLVYDIFEQIGDPAEALDHYTTALDLSWLPAELPDAVTRALMVSGDRDLVVEEIPNLKSRFGAVAGDWESGAIAWVAARNGVRCLILRGVSDLVGEQGDETYGQLDLYVTQAQKIMQRLVGALPGWMEIINYG